MNDLTYVEVVATGARCVVDGERIAGLGWAGYLDANDDDAPVEWVCKAHKR